MFTTLGSTRLASFVNSLPNSWACGITSGVASGAACCPSRAAFTPVLTSVPIRMPTASVTNSSDVDKTFCWRIVSNSFIVSASLKLKARGSPRIHYTNLTTWMCAAPTRFHPPFPRPGRLQERRMLTIRGRCSRAAPADQEISRQLLRGAELEFILLFLMAEAMPFREEFDPLAPQREAALFYGLFLRGHSAEALRRDIDLPKKLIDKLMRRHRNEIAVREKLRRVYQYRKQVLAVFDELVTRQRTPSRIQ